MPPCIDEAPEGTWVGWRRSVLQYLRDVLVARSYAVVGSFVSKGVNQLRVGPASQQSFDGLVAVALARQHQRRPSLVVLYICIDTSTQQKDTQLHSAHLSR